MNRRRWFWCGLGAMVLGGCWGIAQTVLDEGAVERARSTAVVVRENTQDAGPLRHFDPAPALALLERLLVQDKIPADGYSREQFGRAWSDVDHNSCDTRNDILHRDLLSFTTLPTSACIVLEGVLEDPYTGQRLEFRRGTRLGMQVQIDHVVALNDAWRSGAQELEPSRRKILANDPLNLFAVSGEVNRQKGAQDAATWLPPQESFRCPYVARQIAVKFSYKLWVSAQERAAMQRVLRSCPAILSMGSPLG